MVDDERVDEAGSTSSRSRSFDGPALLADRSASDQPAETIVAIGALGDMRGRDLPRTPSIPATLVRRDCLVERRRRPDEIRYPVSELGDELVEALRQAAHRSM
jgi:hypothetical protein